MLGTQGTPLAAQLLGIPHWNISAASRGGNLTEIISRGVDNLLPYSSCPSAMPEAFSHEGIKVLRASQGPTWACVCMAACGSTVLPSLGPAGGYPAPLVLAELGTQAQHCTAALLLPSWTGLTQ